MLNTTCTMRLVPALTFQLVCTWCKTYYVAISAYGHMTVASCLVWVEHSWNSTTGISWWGSTQHERGISPFTNCTVVSFSTVPLCVDGGDLYGTGDSELAITCWWTPEFPPCFSNVSRTAKIFVFLVASLLWVKKVLQKFPANINLHNYM